MTLLTSHNPLLSEPKHMLSLCGVALRGIPSGLTAAISSILRNGAGAFLATRKCSPLTSPETREGSLWLPGSAVSQRSRE
jgi:hypothetical protein